MSRARPGPVRFVRVRPQALRPAPTPAASRGAWLDCRDEPAGRCRLPDSGAGARSSGSAGATESPLVRAMRRRPVPVTPVWFMRQAGRSLPEYRALRAGVGMLEACTRPELITEITLQPVRRHGVDAAILFSDIVVPLRAAGVDLDIVPGVGPVVAEPVADGGGPGPAAGAGPGPGRLRRRGRPRRWCGELGGDAADRLRRRAVHAGELPGRGRPVEGPRPRPRR